MADTPLTDQVLDQIMRDLIEKGIKPWQIYEAVGRVDPTLTASDGEVCFVMGLCDNRDDMVVDPNPWSFRTRPGRGRR